MAARIAVDKSDLVPALAVCVKIANDRLADILATVRVTLRDGQLSLCATDTAMSYTKKIPAIGDDCDYCVSASALFEIASSARDGSQILLVADDRFLEAEFDAGFGRARTKTPVLGATEFPDIDPTPTDPIAMPSETLGLALSSVRPCVGTELTRNYLRGVFLHSVEGAPLFRAAATDGKVAAAFEADAPMGCKIPPSIIPTQSVDVMIGLCKAGGVLSFSVNRSAASLSGDDYCFTSRLIAEEFPPYERVIPDRGGCRVEVDSGTLTAAVGSVAQWSEKRHDGNPIWIDGATDLVLGGRRENGALSTAKIPANISGKLAQTAVIHRLIKVAAGLTEGAVVFYVRDGAGDAMRFERPDVPQGRLFGVVMPYRVPAWPDLVEKTQEAAE